MFIHAGEQRANQSIAHPLHHRYHALFVNPVQADLDANDIMTAASAVSVSLKCPEVIIFDHRFFGIRYKINTKAGEFLRYFCPTVQQQQ